jgi:hypothetical protein
VTDPIANLEALHAAAMADYGDDVFRRLRHVHAYQGAVLDAMPAILRALKAADAVTAEWDRYRESKPRTAFRHECIDELDAALAALTPTETPK